MPCSRTLAATAPAAVAISDGGPLHTQADAPVTLGATLRRAAERAPATTVAYLRADGGAIVQTYGELLADALSILAGLSRLGLLPGDKVIVQLEALVGLPARVLGVSHSAVWCPLHCRSLRPSSSQRAPLTGFGKRGTRSTDRSCSRAANVHRPWPQRWRRSTFRPRG